MSKPKVTITQSKPLTEPVLDSLLGPSVTGYEDRYWHSLPNCPHEAGFLLSGNNIRIPRTIHVPTGSQCSYIKILAILADGSQLPVWIKYDDWSQKSKEPLESNQKGKEVNT